MANPFPVYCCLVRSFGPFGPSGPFRILSNFRLLREPFYKNFQGFTYCSIFDFQGTAGLVKANAEGGI